MSGLFCSIIPEMTRCSAGADEAEEMGIEFDQDLGCQVCHDQGEGFRECGDVPIGDRHAIFDPIDQDIFLCDLRCLLVIIHAEHLSGAELCAGDAEDARSRPDVEDVQFREILILKTYRFDGLQAHPRGGVLAGAECHAGIDLDDDVRADSG